MNDEQTILLGPEEELTSVLERLKNAQARRIILVIPPQTQLRSHVGWRLIYARMRELGKEVLVISPDRQVRAMARAAGFQVTETQEAPSNRPRLGGSGTRPGSINTRGAGRSRIGASRGEPESQARRRFTPNTASKPLPRQSRPTRREEDEETFEKPGRGAASPQISPPTFFEEEQFGRAYDFGIRTTPSVRPSVPQRDEEEEDLQNTYEADYHTAQSILKAAREGSKPAPGESEDDGPDIAERSTVEIEDVIEDLGDLDNIELPEIRSDQAPNRLRLREQEETLHPEPLQFSKRRSPRAPRSDAQDYDDDEVFLPPPSKTPRGAGGQPHSSRGLTNQGQRPSQSLKQGTSQRPSQSLKQGTSQRPSQAFAPDPGRRASRPIAADQQGQRVSQPTRPGTSAQRVATRPPTALVRQQPASVQYATPRSRQGMVITSTLILLLLVGGFVLYYAVPAATVTITLHASAYTQTVHLNAAVSTQANAPNTVPAHTLEHDFSVSAQGTASGTTRVGNAPARGFVTFTNSGTADVTIPSGTLVATLGGTQFTTEAEALVIHNSTLPAVPVPVTAQQPGESGDVAAGSINVIPLSSLAAIAQRSNLNPATITASTLAVTNKDATTGGGAASVPQVTQHDLQALAPGLHKQMQQEVQTWLAQQIKSGDMRGKLMPDVLGSPDKLNEEQLSAAPAVGQPTSTSGAFSGSLTLHVSVLVARNKDVQVAAGALLNAAALQMHPAKVLAMDLPVTLTHIQSTQSADNSTLAISADARGALIPQLDLAALASSLTNKSINQAESDLKNGVGVPNLTGVQGVQISISPAFLSILPVQAGRIQIRLQPIQETPPQHLPNGT